MVGSRTEGTYPKLKLPFLQLLYFLNFWCCYLLCWVEVTFLFCFCELFRCREKQRKESSRLQAVNRKLTAMNKLLMEENDRLQKQVSQLVYENGYFRQHTQIVRFLFVIGFCNFVINEAQFKRSQIWIFISVVLANCALNFSSALLCIYIYIYMWML